MLSFVLMYIASKILFYFSLNKFALCVSTLEPDSIIEKQGWEICWAKPIGTKNLNRQQHIHEAATNTNFISEQIPYQKTETSRPKQAKNKKDYIKTEIEAHEDDSVYLVQMKILQSFVKERFDATCTFDCISLPDTSEYVGNVSFLI